ncbi:hypothetical protein C2G38_2192493 [Gigaspora rosea]|uniref:F-box domain-containing protein n=1 Tax=Gigaspora rosea TaxID=44941 RepID=A0A397V601_9GLOM|nr:hypothetical protein C2G38_2192493 [Gigaspora rosea]
MASKVLMGNMPELMENILKNLNNELDSLYSCALVSRHWCKMSIPILWQDPFSSKRKPLFIPIYFSSLDENEKFALKECLKEGLKLKNGLISKLGKPELRQKLLSDSWTNPLITLQFKLFLESGATLHKLDLYHFEYLKFESEIFLSLEQNEQFFSRLQDLSLDVIPVLDIENITKLLRILAKNTTKISVLALDFYSNYESRLIEKLFPALIHLIKSQEQLRKFILNCPKEDYPTAFHGIVSALESQKNSLQEVKLDGCGFSAEFEVLNNCKNLETFRIRCCNTNLLKILDYNISTLEIVGFQIDVPTIVQILGKFGILLQRFKFESEGGIWEESLLIEALKSFCPNITYLYITDIGFSTQLLELIGNLQKLQFLSLGYLRFAYDITEEELKIRVMQIAKILPSTLQYLDLANTWVDSVIDILLNHCNAPLRKLLIGRGSLDNEKHTKAHYGVFAGNWSPNLNIWSSKLNFSYQIIWGDFNRNSPFLQFFEK